MPEPLEPMRAWDDLIATSVRRGRVLRRRRGLALTSGPAAGVAVVVALLLTLGGSPTDSLQEVPAVSPSPHATATGRPVVPNVERDVAPVDGAGTAGARRPQSTTAPRAAGPAALPRPEALRSPSRALGRTLVSIADARGDGVPTRAYGLATAPAVPGQSSDDALDIVRVDYEAQRVGLQITMTLAGAHREDGRYWAYVTDTTTGCRLQVLLGGPDPDGFWDSCDAAGTWHQVPTRIDPSASVLQALLPWDALPRGVDPRHVLGSLYGETTYTNAGGGTIFADEARSSQTMGPVR